MLLGILLVLTRAARGETISVPARLQANLTFKLLSYDRALSGRAGDKVRVLVEVDPSEGQSQAIANEFAAAMQAKTTLNGLPIEVSMSSFTSAPAIADDVKRNRVSAVYLSSGIGRVAEQIAEALKGADVMTIAAEPSAVVRGISVGFDLQSGQPKILVNLKQARLQNVQLPGSVLALALIQGG